MNKTDPEHTVKNVEDKVLGNELQLTFKGKLTSLDAAALPLPSCPPIICDSFDIRQGTHYSPIIFMISIL